MGRYERAAFKSTFPTATNVYEKFLYAEKWLDNDRFDVTVHSQAALSSHQSRLGGQIKLSNEMKDTDRAKVSLRSQPEPIWSCIA